MLPLQNEKKYFKEFKKVLVFYFNMEPRPPNKTTTKTTK